MGPFVSVGLSSEIGNHLGEIIAGRLVNSHRQRLKQNYPDSWKWITLAERLSGDMTEKEAYLLLQLARTRTPLADPLIVELRAEQAKTAFLLAGGLRGKARPRVVSFPRSAGIPDSRTLQRILRRCQLEPVVRMLDYPAGASSNRVEPIDILLINAGGDDSWREDLVQWSPRVKPGGIVVLRRAGQNEALRSSAYMEFRQADQLAWASPAKTPQNRIEWSTATLHDYVRRSALELAEKRHAIEALRRSWSWRLTAPLRLGIDMVQAVFGLLTSLSNSPQSTLHGFIQWVRFRRRILRSGIFDERFYRENHPGAPWAHTNPLLHFFVRGAKAEIGRASCRERV